MAPSRSPFPSLRISPVSVGEAILRIELDGLIEIGHCSVQIALPKLDIFPVVVSEGVIRIELDGLSEISYCSVSIAFLCWLSAVFCG
jgi:hypothetical protein